MSENERITAADAPLPFLGPKGLLIFILAGIIVGMYYALTRQIETLQRSQRHLILTQKALEELPGRFQVVNAHEHLYKRAHLANYFKAAEATGVARTIFVASGGFTLLGDKSRKDDMFDENSREILAAAKEYPGKIIPFCSISPKDPRKLDLLKEYVALGAKGLKLYTGHTDFYEADKPFDAPDMLEIYAYCEQIGLPIIWHVSFNRFRSDFEKILDRFPRLKVIVPHFGVTFFRPDSPGFHYMNTMLEKYPNLYFDTSFGTRAILVQGLEIVSSHPEIFREFIVRHSDRIVFGTDMVVTGNQLKTPEWQEACIRACRDMLEKDNYHFFMAAKGSEYAYKSANNTYGELRGLALPNDVLKRIYETNIQKILGEN